MDEHVAPALPGIEGEWTLVVQSHYRLADKPARTLEMLRLFLPDEAGAAFAALRAGQAPVVRTGRKAEIERLAVWMEAQGFRVRVLPKAASPAPGEGPPPPPRGG